MTPGHIRTSRRADEDIETAVDHYLREAQAGSSTAFIDDLEAVFDLVTAHPSIGSTRFAVETGIPELRSLALRRFPHIVFYIESDGIIRVARVLHARRDLPTALGIDE